MMELYLLDDKLRRVEVIEGYKSVIWTERWQGVGDLELVIKSTPQTRQWFRPGSMFSLSRSYRIMTVETVIDSVDNDGARMLRVSGQSLERILRDRTVAKSQTPNQPEIYTGSPENIMWEMFRNTCMYGNLSAYDEIPYLVLDPNEGPLDLGTNTPPVPPSIYWEQQPEALLGPLETLAKMYDLGFRFIFDPEIPEELHFHVYHGYDRTEAGSYLVDPVIFSQYNGSYTNLTRMTTVNKSKNVAYVFTSSGEFEEVYADDANPAYWFDRRVLTVHSDLPPGTPNTQANREAMGKEALRQYQAAEIVDGEINNRAAGYIYDQDYSLGDVVELVDENGISSLKRVSEQIFISDTEGVREFPTLSFTEAPNENWW